MYYISIIIEKFIYKVSTIDKLTYFITEQKNHFEKKKGRALCTRFLPTRGTQSNPYTFS